MSHELSEKVLEILSQSNFTAGLAAGLPTNTKISHKFGERTVTDNLGVPVERELHDCGIVYYPKHPYFLCVMTKGTDFKSLESTIGSVSKIVWDDVAAY